MFPHFNQVELKKAIYVVTTSTDYFLNTYMYVQTDYSAGKMSFTCHVGLVDRNVNQQPVK